MSAVRIVGGTIGLVGLALGAYGAHSDLSEKCILPQGLFKRRDEPLTPEEQAIKSRCDRANNIGRVGIAMVLLGASLGLADTITTARAKAAR